MGNKKDPGAFDCYSAAADDEPMFILLARDPLAPALVRAWARERRALDGNTPKVQEAVACAVTMENWWYEHRGTT